jgi:hypothetical protein
MKNNISIFVNEYLTNSIEYKKAILKYAFYNNNTESLKKDFFLNIPYLFEPAITFSDTLIRESCIPALLYYQYILFIDDIVDNGIVCQKTEFKDYITKATFSLMLGSIELSEHFKKNINLVIKFNKLFEQYLHIILWEKEIFSSPNFNIDVAKQIATGKHCLVFFYLELLFKDNDKIQLKDNILQLIDDIEDIEKDYETRSMTLPIYRLDNYFKNNHIENKVFDLRYLCISGEASELYQLAIKNLEYAKEKSILYKFDNILSFIELNIKICNTKIATITKLINDAKSK